MQDNIFQTTVITTLLAASCTSLAQIVPEPALKSKSSANVSAGVDKPNKQEKQEKILILGDSLSAEYGLKKGEGWVALMEKRLATENVPAQIQNVSISGETTSGGRSRIESILATHKPTLVVLELGANDALRGLPIKNTHDNLTYIIEKSQQMGAKVLLVGMEIPPNFGGTYGREFQAVFPKVAQEKNVPLVGFLLKGVADIPDAPQYFQADRVHPNAKAHSIILDNVWEKIKPMLNASPNSANDSPSKPIIKK